MILRNFKKQYTVNANIFVGVAASPVDTNMFEWIAIIKGWVFHWSFRSCVTDYVSISGTICQRPSFRLSLKFLDNCPSEPPKIRFTSKIYHPNIYGDGDVCLKVLQQGWSPALGVKFLLPSLQKLLDELNADDPTNAVAAIEYKNDYETYFEKVSETILENEKNEGGSSSWE